MGCPILMQSNTRANVDQAHSEYIPVYQFAAMASVLIAGLDRSERRVAATRYIEGLLMRAGGNRMAPWRNGWAWTPNACNCLSATARGAMKQCGRRSAAVWKRYPTNCTRGPQLMAALLHSPENT
ncbi:MAG TPA: hypothetical protein VMX16_17715 [Terriglobia bacterium]|nr:hypothetical protein [Terriglobia bacterium]